MDPHHPMTRRDSLKRLLGLTGCVALTGGIASPFELPSSALAGSKKIGFLVEGVGQTEGYSIRALTRRTFETVGGMGRFVSRGDVVVIKPNLSWARPPRLAATTDPEVLPGRSALFCPYRGGNGGENHRRQADISWNLIDTRHEDWWESSRRLASFHSGGGGR
jgi:hypothetical protein